VWARLSDDLWGLPCELTFDPSELSADVRHVMVLPRAGAALPEGLLPLTSYRVKDVDLPAGVEGINAFLERIVVRGTPEDLTLISPQGEEVRVKRAPLFERAL
jgi:hypothetical protein